jgi:phosphoglycerate dehydrogenase-like enzyme
VHNALEDAPLHGNQRQEFLHNSDVIVTGWGADGLSEGDYAAAPNLKMIALVGSSIKGLCPEFAWERGICITNTARAIGKSVAEYTVGAILSWLHRYGDYDLALKNHADWNASKQLFVQQDMCDLTVGLIGYGAVGGQVAALLTSLGTDVAVYDPFVAREHLLEQKLRPVASLEELLRGSDVISLHAGLNDSTRGMIGQAQLALMKQDALLVNTSRGPLIDERALVEALNAKRIHAVLDVFCEEPLPPHHPLRQAPNISLSPHVAGFSNRSVYRRCCDTVVDDILRFLNGKTAQNVVTPKMYRLMT